MRFAILTEGTRSLSQYAKYKHGQLREFALLDTL